MRKSNKRPRGLASCGDQPFGFGCERRRLNNGRPVGGHGFPETEESCSVSFAIKEVYCTFPASIPQEGAGILLPDLALALRTHHDHKLHHFEVRHHRDMSRADSGPQKHPLQLSARRDGPAILDDPPYLHASQ